MKAIIRKSLPAALTATLVAGAAVTIPAVAATDDGADDTTEESADAAESDGLRGFGRHRLGHGLEEGELAERLAAELGLDTDTVQDAIDAVKSDLGDERLAEAVENGQLTQEQADAIAAAIAEGDREAAREVLDEVRLAALEERLAEKVEAGELTQEEADELLERAEDGDFPGRRGRRGHGARSGDAASDEATTDEAGSCTVDIDDEGEWTVRVDTSADGGRLVGLMTVRVAGPFALIALPVRYRPD